MQNEDAASRLDDWLELLDEDDVRALLRQASNHVPQVRDWLEIQRAASSDSPNELLGMINETLKPGRRFYDYWQANRYAEEGADVVDLLETKAQAGSPDLVPVIERAITLATRAILKSDDSSGLQGDQIRTLLDAHATAVRTATPPLTQAQQSKLVKWIVKYRYGGTQDFFDPDIVAYAPGLSEKSISAYRAAIADADLGPYSTYPLERLAVLDRDRDAILAAHGGEPSNPMVAERLVDDFVEAELWDDALHYARIGVELDSRGWNQKLVNLLVERADAQGDQDEALRLRRSWFTRFPGGASFASLRATAECWGAWQQERVAAEEMLAARSPHAYVRYLLDEGRSDDAWTFAMQNREALVDAGLWQRLCTERARTRPADTLPIYRQIVLDTLEVTDKRNYRAAAKTLTTMRKVAHSAGAADDFAEFLARVIDENRRRPTCIAAFKRAGLIPTS
ncbi:hypothetical protein [Paramicrobacterium agarici]|uniref:Uncharacterized protein n=1 Tax=Paramicrobacterium agarici TaxID=630514 RepID=A0A2A9DVZ7_9MICO|nr:hypothetical protein [Microbacterium agarici]PFG30754.1 hypothetical protein ATJ78_1691 [Microbacterium agarici]